MIRTIWLILWMFCPYFFKTRFQSWSGESWWFWASDIDRNHWYRTSRGNTEYPSWLSQLERRGDLQLGRLYGKTVQTLQLGIPSTRRRTSSESHPHLKMAKNPKNSTQLLRIRSLSKSLSSAPLGIRLKQQFLSNISAFSCYFISPKKMKT